MYNWRKMTESERQEILEYRKQNRVSWHNPPHFSYTGENNYFITAACYNHLPIIGKSKERLLECENAILSACQRFSNELFAWCVLPNHYHILLQTDNIKNIRRELGLFHGRSSRSWNLEDNQLGRKVWHNCLERFMRSERHYYASLNYIHHNPVHHEYVVKWTDWQFSSAQDYLEKVGRDIAAEIWREYPLLDYGKKWDV